MTPRHSAQNGDQADEQKDSVQPFDKPESLLGLQLGLGEQPTVEDERFGNEN